MSRGIVSSQQPEASPPRRMDDAVLVDPLTPVPAKFSVELATDLLFPLDDVNGQVPIICLMRLDHALPIDGGLATGQDDARQH